MFNSELVNKIPDLAKKPRKWEKVLLECPDEGILRLHFDQYIHWFSALQGLRAEVKKSEQEYRIIGRKQERAIYIEKRF